MCVGLWDCLSLGDQNKTFSRRRKTRIGTVEMDVGRRPVLSGTDEPGVLSGTDEPGGNTGRPLKQKVWTSMLSRIVIFRLQALSVAQPIPAITMERGLLLPFTKKKTQELVSSLLSSALLTHIHWERKLCSKWSRVHDFCLFTEMHESSCIPSIHP